MSEQYIQYALCNVRVGKKHCSLEWSEKCFCVAREGQDLSRYVPGSILGAWNTVGTREYDCSH